MELPRRGLNICFLIIGIVAGVSVTWGILHLYSDKEEASGLEMIVSAVDYPFDYSTEGWSLVLCEMGADSIQSGREFRMYDAGGRLVQVFPCGIEEGEIIFRFDQLFYYYGYNEDLLLFPAGAEDTGAMGLCYPWDDEEKRFSEDPVVVPWYQERDTQDDNSFVVSRTVGNVEIDTICRINEESRQVVELRRWTLITDEEEDGGNGRETLHIWDCLEQKDIFFGYVERDELGNLVNDKYYQFLFWDGLHHFWQWESDQEINIYHRTEEGWRRDGYADKEAFLEACGFAGEEPFYQYYDSYQNLILELYFDARTGQGCGIFYGYNYNYELEKVTRCWGFSFDETEKEKWENDTFSTLSYNGLDARRDNVSGYQEICKYTDDGLLSSFEARGTVVDYGEGGPWESSLLSMDYIYRGDNTLYYKHYSHHHILFGTTYCAKSGYYDKLGRVVYEDAYVTHGWYYFFYIYEGSRMEPDHCLMLDMNMSDVFATMISY